MIRVLVAYNLCSSEQIVLSHLDELNNNNNVTTWEIFPLINLFFFYISYEKNRENRPAREVFDRRTVGRGQGKEVT